MNSQDKAYYDKYRKFYNKYQKVRRIKLRQDPLCERCIAKDIPIIKSAQEVHHRKHISEGHTYEQKYILATDINNLESLCIDCHLIEHKKYNIPSEFW
jgi:5-methylcytosine-specific restriction endonuclease McrA